MVSGSSMPVNGVIRLTVVSAWTDTRHHTVIAALDSIDIATPSSVYLVILKTVN